MKFALGDDNVLVKFALDVADLEATGDELNVDKGLYEMGFKHNVNDLAERYGRKVPEKGDEYLSKDKATEDKATELANVAGGDHHENQERNEKGRFGSMSAVGMYSDVVNEVFQNEDEVFKRHQSERQKLLKEASARIDAAHGVRSIQYDSFGDWGTGFESSVLTEFYDVDDSDLLVYLMARRGADNGQMGTALFELDKDGEDLMFEVNGFKTVSDARALMDEHGLPFRTISRNADKEWTVRILTNEVAKDRDNFESIVNVVSDERVSFYRGKFTKIGDWDFENGTHANGVRLQQLIVENYGRKNRKIPEQIPGQNERSKGQGIDWDGTDSSLANSKGMGRREQKKRIQHPHQKQTGFKSWLGKFFANNKPAVDETAAYDAEISALRAALQKDFEPLAAQIAAALNEQDPALRKALLLKIADSPVPASENLTEAFTIAMGEELLGALQGEEVA